MSKTFLQLPAEPNFFCEHWLDGARHGRVADVDGFTWCWDRDTPGLNIGYLIRNDELPSRLNSKLMSRDAAFAHACAVRAVYGVEAKS